MRFKHTALVALALFTVTAGAAELPTAAPESVGMSSERLQRITEQTQAYVDAGKLAGVLTMVARNGQVVHTSTVGQRGAEDDRPLTEDALFRIYSMTKPITAVAAMILYEEGKFHLDDPVSKFVPELEGLDVYIEGGRVPAKMEMTMHQLLTHTAGLSYGFNPEDPVDQLYGKSELLRSADMDQFIERLAKLPLKYQPGTQWHYSVAVDVTGTVVERISGQSFDVFLKERIFDPLDMPDTFFNVPAAKRDRFLPNHTWDAENEKLVQMGEDGQFGNWTDTGFFSGGGGLVSTARDYLRFAETLRNGGVLDGVRILGPKTVEFMAMDHLPASVTAGGRGERPTMTLGEERFSGMGFGLGFGVITDPAALGVLTSAGEYNWGGAAGTLFWIDPVEEIVVVSMIQLLGSPWRLREDLMVLTAQAITELAE